MQTIDVRRIAEAAGLDIQQVAEHLFPDIKHPRKALVRVINGESLLNSDQLSKLASMAGCSVSDLYGGTKWSMKGQGKVVLFESEDFSAKLDTDTFNLQVFHKSSLFHEDVLVHKALPFSELLGELNRIINQYIKEHECS